MFTGKAEGLQANAPKIKAAIRLILSPLKLPNSP
jgi:hypothetical protein